MNHGMEAGMAVEWKPEYAEHPFAVQVGGELGMRVVCVLPLARPTGVSGAYTPHTLGVSQVVVAVVQPHGGEIHHTLAANWFQPVMAQAA